MANKRKTRKTNQVSATPIAEDVPMSDVPAAPASQAPTFGGQSVHHDTVVFSGTADLRESIAHKLDIEAARRRGQSDGESHIKVADLFQLLDKMTNANPLTLTRGYSKARALFIRWEEDDLGSEHNDRSTTTVFAELREVLENSYSFQTDVLVLASHSPAFSLQTGLAHFLAQHDSADTLLCIVYGGMARLSIDASGRQASVWHARREDGPSLVWTDFQNMLGYGQSRILMLLNSFKCSNETQSSRALVEGIWASDSVSDIEKVITDNSLFDWILFALVRNAQQSSSTTAWALWSNILTAALESKAERPFVWSFLHTDAVTRPPSIELVPDSGKSTQNCTSTTTDSRSSLQQVQWPLVQLSVRVEVPPGEHAAFNFMTTWRQWQNQDIVDAEESSEAKAALRKTLHIEGLARGLLNNRVVLLITLPEQLARRLPANSFTTFIAFVSSASVLAAHEEPKKHLNPPLVHGKYDNQFCCIESYDQWAIEDEFTVPDTLKEPVQQALANMAQTTSQARDLSLTGDWASALTGCVDAVRAQGVGDDCLEMTSWPGTSNPYSLLGLKNLAVAFLRSEQDLQLAEQFFVMLIQALQEKEGQHYDDDGLRTLSVWYCLAMAYGKNEQWSKARDAWKALIDVCKKNSDRLQALLVASMKGYASLNYVQGHYTQAVLLDLDARELDTRSGGKDREPNL